MKTIRSERTVEFEDGSQLVAIDWGDSSVSLQSNGPLLLNIARINADGSIRWFIDAEPRSKMESYFNPPHRRDGDVFTVDLCGYEYRIDVNKGIALPTGRWFK